MAKYKKGDEPKHRSIFVALLLQPYLDKISGTILTSLWRYVAQVALQKPASFNNFF